MFSSDKSAGVVGIAVAVVVILVFCGAVFVVWWKRHMVSCGSVHIQAYTCMGVSFDVQRVIINNREF